jgi:hypothetical protein
MVDPMALPVQKPGQLRRLRGVAVMTALVMTALALTVPVAVTPAAAQAQTAATPNAVITWNTHAQTAIYEMARQSPTGTTRSFAMVQGAVYDAVNAIAGTPYEPYLIAPPATPSDSSPTSRRSPPPCARGTTSRSPRSPTAPRSFVASRSARPPRRQ